MPSRHDSEILSIEEIKYVFNGAVLQPGDILLMNTYHELQRKIKRIPIRRVQSLITIGFFSRLSLTIRSYLPIIGIN